MQVMLMRLMSKGEYLIVPKGTKFTGLGKLGLNDVKDIEIQVKIVLTLGVYNWSHLCTFSSVLVQFLFHQNKHIR